MGWNLDAPSLHKPARSQLLGHGTRGIMVTREIRLGNRMLSGPADNADAHNIEVDVAGLGTWKRMALHTLWPRAHRSRDCDEWKEESGWMDLILPTSSNWAKGGRVTWHIIIRHESPAERHRTDRDYWNGLSGDKEKGETKLVGSCTPLRGWPIAYTSIPSQYLARFRKRGRQR